MPGSRGSVPRRGAEDLRREDDHPPEGLQRAPCSLQQAGVRPPHPARLHDLGPRRALLAQPGVHVAKTLLVAQRQLT